MTRSSPVPTTAPPPLTRQDRETFQSWVDQNPLRTWRYSHEPKQLPILEAAQRMGVGMSMIQMWERGVHRPGPAKMDKLAEYLGADIADRWDAWLVKRPAR